MREVKFIAYTFKELGEGAKQKAIEECRKTCFDFNSKTDWEEFSETKKKFLALARANCDIEQNSQGFYVKHWQRNEEFFEGMAEEEMISMLNERVLNDMQGNCAIWTDDVLVDIVDTRDDTETTYMEYVCNILLQLAKFVYDDSLDFLNDDEVIKFITSNDYEFTEKGFVI